MKQQGAPTITAPLSRRTKRNSNVNNSSMGIICAVISAIVAFGGTIILAIAMISSSSSTTNNNDVISARTGINAKQHEGSLRQPSIANNNIETIEHEDVSNTPSSPQGLIIHTHIGDIRIHFTPELAGESSIKYITNVVQSASSKQNSGMTLSAETVNGRKVTEGYKCQRCKFYRAERDLLLQGVIAEPSIAKNQVLGPCPDTNYIPKNKCPDHDPQCGCHGPIMTKGMVGWAGGGGGPDFFINTFKKPVDWWEMQHTVWGMIHDEQSMKVVESAYDLPVHGSGMKMLDQEIEISLELF